MFGVVAHDTDFSYADLRGAKLYSVHQAKRVRFDHALLGDPGTWNHSSPTSFTDNILPSGSFVGTDLRSALRPPPPTLPATLPRPSPYPPPTPLTRPLT